LLAHPALTGRRQHCALIFDVPATLCALHRVSAADSQRLTSKSAPDQAMTLRRFTVTTLVIAVVVIVVGVLIWASDKLTLQGEHTIYSVQCRDGTWQGWRCTGRLVASDRFRFRASRSRQEVIFWVVGSRQPSGKYTDCVVKDRDNWKCNASPDQPAAVTNELIHGRPEYSGTGPAGQLHAVRKWKWWILYGGIHAFSNADY
jgi:hypothetical protein